MSHSRVPRTLTTAEASSEVAAGRGAFSDVMQGPIMALNLLRFRTHGNAADTP
jgi:hypothetical protein